MQNEAKKRIELLEELLCESNFESSPILTKQYNYEITVKKNKQKLKILVYFGKKGIKTIIQGNKESDTYNEAEQIVTGNFSLEFAKVENNNFEEYIGTDETGKGDFFGPLVVAGMYVDRNVQDFLVSLNVRDSKEIGDYQINQIADKIKQKYPNNYSIISISPKKYNELYEKFKNLNKILSWAHSRIIKDLLNRFSTETVIIDKFRKEPIDIANNYEYRNINFIQVHKAEKYIGVAAASILARERMNKWFLLKQKEGYKVIKGASKDVENAAKDIFNSNGKEKINELVKLHFKTSKKIFENL